MMVSPNEFITGWMLSPVTTLIVYPSVVFTAIVFGAENNGGGLNFSFVLLFVHVVNNSIEKRYGSSFFNRFYLIHDFYFSEITILDLLL